LCANGSAQNRTPSSNPNPDYARLHEIARHVTHSSETLEVAVGTVDSMLRQHKEFLEERPGKASETATVCISKRTAKILEFQSQMLQNFKLRSQSNGERLQNEITLVSTSPTPSRGATIDERLRHSILSLNTIAV
jgi:hypothetical protein